MRSRQTICLALNVGWYTHSLCIIFRIFLLLLRFLESSRGAQRYAHISTDFQFSIPFWAIPVQTWRCLALSPCKSRNTHVIIIENSPVTASPLSASAVGPLVVTTLISWIGCTVRRLFFVFVFLSLTFFIIEIAGCIISQEGSCSQQRVAKWGSLPALGGFEPTFFTSKRHDLIGLATEVW